MKSFCASLLAAVGLCACGGAGSTSNASSQVVGNQAPASFSLIKNVFIIVMENHNWSDIFNDDDCPYINKTMLPQSSYATDYRNPKNNHPSEPNYLWMEAGTNFGVTNDNDPSQNHQSTTAHLTAQLTQAGVSWKSYQEDISGTDCPLTSVNKYQPKHNPMVFFDDVTGTNDSQSQNCIDHVRPYTELENDLSNNTVADYNFITPNLCDDMHDPLGCPNLDESVNGDKWLSREVPKLLSSAVFQNGGALFLTWDESEGPIPGVNWDNEHPIGMIVLSPFVKGGGYNNNLPYTHSSYLKTVQEIFNVGPLLGDAATTSTLDLGDFFK